MIKKFDEFLNESNNDLKDEIREDIKNDLKKIRKSYNLEDDELDLLFFGLDKKDEVEYIQFYVTAEKLHDKELIKDLKRIGKNYDCPNEEIDEVKSSIFFER